MEYTQQRYKRSAGKSSFDGPAIAKGWFVAVGLWLVGTLISMLITEILSEGGSGSFISSSLGIWAVFSVASVLVAGVLGLPLALLLNRFMRQVQTPWIHVLAFAMFFTLSGAILMSGMTGSFLSALGVSCWMGLCAAAGRLAAFRKSGAFHRVLTGD
ncbi:hypothetical protein CQ018_03025 [Arthrobacter sp. MYb227]|uniref:hypothetical protein n=1 Tax=Arthrobacter sp. MYb227 TaxID=1848601 RepID=UPI000CFD67E9|nr:hypothetical protein [Arthrobacter sp. MYb227]PQZ96262.1 hypothetical protein CQ018_03025 [Arthrobacter sp. MYb227]